MEREKKKLGLYRDKRAPGVTNEPFGEEPSSRAGPEEAATGPTAFVVHLHSATRRHYDVRLEVGGVLWSFAVPRGPSLDPKEKVLAVKTEDHPIEYVDFEDVIPPGQYGAGPMIVWDRGAVRYLEGPPEEELANGKLHIELEGMKLRGRWAFIKLAKSDKGNEWLLFKKEDAASDPKRSITDELPRSILSGLTVDELRDRDAIGKKLVARARKLGADEDAKLTGELRAQERSPLVATRERASATRAVMRDLVYDVELGGVRVLAVRDGDVVTLRTWTQGKPEAIEDFYPDVVRALRALPVTKLALDGELVAFDASGRPSTTLLAQRALRIDKGDVHRAVTTTPVVLVAFDALALGDADLRGLALGTRRDLLAELAPAVGILRAGTPLEGESSRVLATCASLDIASVVAKKKTSRYEPKAGWHVLPTGLAAPSRPAVRHGSHGGRRAPHVVPVTNKDKVFWPGDDSGKGRYTKGDLVAYYASVADVLVPYLKDRPTILVRYPDGIHGKSFFQWNVPVGMPPWVRTMTMHEDEDFVATPNRPDHGVSRPPPASRSAYVESQVVKEKTPRRVFLVDDRATLLYIANLGCIPLHVLASRAPDLTRSDFLTVDFDVKQSELRHAITLTEELGELLDKIGLPAFPKTSGQTGLHVLVALGPNQTFDTARALADLLGRLLVDRHPKVATMERIVAKRGERVYVDTGQTGTSRAIVAPYSVRAVAGATVSTPLTWNEVGPKLDPKAFTIETVPKRVAAKGDLLEGLLGAQPDIPAAVEKLSRMIAARSRSA